MYQHGWLINWFGTRECPHCNGTGYVAHGPFPPLSCDDCNGTGIAPTPGFVLIAWGLIAIGSIASIVVPIWYWWPF